MSTILSVVSVLVVGLMVGVELSVALFVNPIFDRLPDGAALAARADGARTLGRAMPFWYAASVLLAVVWTLTSWSTAGGARWATSAAVVLLATSVLMSVLWLVPINDRVTRWSGSDFPADWRDQVHAWDLWHHARVGVIVLAFVLLVCAAVR